MPTSKEHIDGTPKKFTVIVYRRISRIQISTIEVTALNEHAAGKIACHLESEDYTWADEDIELISDFAIKSVEEKTQIGNPEEPI